MFGISLFALYVNDGKSTKSFHASKDLVCRKQQTTSAVIEVQGGAERARTGVDDEAASDNINEYHFELKGRSKSCFTPSMQFTASIGQATHQLT